MVASQIPMRAVHDTISGPVSRQKLARRAELTQDLI